MTDIQKHTPGPWETFGNTVGKGCLTIAKIPTKTTRELYEAGGAVTFDEKVLSQEDAEANIRLIAAAPDLLKALEEVHETLMREAKHLDGRILNLVARCIDPALRKAEGRQS